MPRLEDLAIAPRGRTGPAFNDTLTEVDKSQLLKVFENTVQLNPTSDSAPAVG